MLSFSERFCLTLDCLSLGRSQWMFMSLSSSLSERAGGPWGFLGSAREVYLDSHRDFCHGTQLRLLRESSLPWNVPGCPPPPLGSAWESLGTPEYWPTQWEIPPPLPQGWGARAALSELTVEYDKAVQNLSEKLKSEPCALQSQVATLICRFFGPFRLFCTRIDMTLAHKLQ